MEQTDAAAVAQVLAGERDAFRLLVERHSRSIFQVAYRMMGNRDDADEVVQETFLRAYRRLEGFELRSSFKTWVYRIAVNCALDLLESKKNERGRVVPRDEDGETLPLEVADTAPGPERQAMGRQMHAAVQRSLELLTPVERTAFLLRHVEQRSIEEISAALKIKPGATKNCIFRAVKKMRQALEPAMRSAV